MGGAVSSGDSGVAGRQPSGDKPGEASNRPVQPVVGKRPDTRKATPMASPRDARKQNSEKQSSGKKDNAQQEDRQKSSNEKKR
jgi:hypothetical protein